MQSRKPKSLKLFALLMLISAPAHAEDIPGEADSLAAEIKHLEGKKTIGDNTGLPLPRWASLKSNKINARSGPGDTYPVKIIYTRASLPVEIISEFKLWREIRDIEGETGWVHKAMLSGNRYVIAMDDINAIGRSNQITAKIQRDAQVQIDECTATLCEIKAGRATGWIEKSKIWGVYPNEIFD